MADETLVEVMVSLPLDFPTVLPIVKIDRSRLKRKIPHVEKSGKICIAPTTGVLLDPDNISGLIVETLDRAKRVLEEGLSGRSARDLQTEFLAYWNSGADEMISICQAQGEARAIVIAELVANHGTVPHARRKLLAESIEAARTWLRPLNGEIVRYQGAFFVPFHTSFDPPDFGESLSAAQVRELIRSNTTVENREAFNKWLHTVFAFPVTAVFSLPSEHSAEENILVGIRFDPPVARALSRSNKGFRPGRTPAAVSINYARNQPCGRIALDRFDPAFLLPRGGAAPELLRKCVTVIGCGSVGAHIAQQLSAAGVGELRLIDGETFSNANCHRHVLGVKHVGQNKATALCDDLSGRFPHLRFIAEGKQLEATLSTNPTLVTDADAIVIAIGDETLSLGLNRFLRGKLQIHAWLDPLGLGGHVLGSDGISAGCFECLFTRHPTYGLYNAASFAEAGQTFQRSFAGCAGVFTPYGALDAIRTATMAACCTVKALTSLPITNVLISWRGDTETFDAQGFRRSKRAELFATGEERGETKFVSKACSVCGVAQ